MIRILNGVGAGREHIMRLRSAGDQTGPANETSRGLFGEPLTPEQVVARIIADVQSRGDRAVREWTVKLDGVTLSDLTVGQDEPGCRL